MTNDIIFIDGQEGFIDLILPLSMVWRINGVQREECFTPLGKFFLYDKTYPYRKNVRTVISLPCYFKEIKKTKLTKRIIVLNQNMSRLSEEYFKLDSGYDNKLIKLTKEQKRLFNLIKLTSNKKLKKEYDKIALEINRLHFLKKRVTIPFKSKYLFGLIRYAPKKYISYPIEKYKYIKEGELEGCGIEYECLIYSLKIDYHSLSYLEQQNSLNRIKLSKEEINLLKAMKEFLRIKDDKMNFDDYIDNWASRLLNNRYEVLKCI